MHYLMMIILVYSPTVLPHVATQLADITEVVMDTKRCYCLVSSCFLSQACTLHLRPSCLFKIMSTLEVKSPPPLAISASKDHIHSAHWMSCLVKLRRLNSSHSVKMHCGSHAHHDIVYEQQKAPVDFKIMNINLQGFFLFSLAQDIVTSICISYVDITVWCDRKLKLVISWE